MDLSTCSQRELNTAEEDGRQHAILFIDRDQFTKVHRLVGSRAAGVRVQRLAMVLTAAVHRGDTVTLQQ